MTVLGNYDVVIIGGGACGSTTAWFLHQEGASVALVEKGVVGREAAWASAGMIGPRSCSVRDPWFLAATTLSKQYYDDLIVELKDLTGRQIGYGGEGHLLIARTEEALPDFHAQVEALKGSDTNFHLLSGERAREQEPALPDDVLEAVWKPTGRFLDARNYTETIALAAAAGAVVWCARSERVRDAVDRMKVKVPLLGQIWVKYQVSQFCRLLATLLQGGIPLPQALETTGNSLGSRLLQDSVTQARRLVQEGQSLSDGMRRAGIFPSLAVEMVHVGESTGALPEMLGSVAEFFDDDVNTMMTAALSLIEPAIMIFMGTFVAFVLISLYLPIFSLAETIR